MARKRLTDRFVASCRAEEGQRVEFWDEDARGLCLRVSGATKTWIYRYRRADGTQPRVTIGRYVAPDQALAFGDGDGRALTVAGARAEARRLRGLLDQQRDPATERQQARAEAKAQPLKTLDDLSAAYFAACESGEYRPRKKVKRATTLKGERWLYDKHLKPTLGDLRIEAVGREQIRGRLRALVAAGHGVTANRARALLRQMFAWAAQEGRVTSNPAAELAAPVEERPRERVLTDDEIRHLWSALESIEGLRVPAAAGDPQGDPVTVSRAVRIALQLSLLTGQRRGEIAAMRVDQIDFDRAIWMLPPEATKAGRAHAVPLTPWAIDLLREALALRSRPTVDGESVDSPFVFPGKRTPLTQPIGASAISQAVRDLRVALKIADITPHDARRTVATGMAMLGISPLVISKLLNHAPTAAAGALITQTVYIRHDFAEEKRKALEVWEHHLRSVLEEGSRAAA